MGGINDPQHFVNLMIGDPNQPIATQLHGGLDLTTELTGDSTKPVTTLLTGDPNKPVSNLMTGDPTKPLATLILGDPTRPIATVLEGNPTKPVTTNSTVDLGLDNIHIKELPRIELSTEIGIKPTRIHNPVDLKLCISLLGLEILSFEMCGESMTIIEPYVPHKTEECP